MGCIESLEQKVAQVEERIRQVIEADEYFVSNMQIVATTHKFNQSHILGDFQFMKSNPETKVLLRRFLSQLRDIDFIQTAYMFSLISKKEVPQKVEDPRLEDLFRPSVNSSDETGLDLKQSIAEKRKDLIPLKREPVGPLSKIDERIRRLELSNNIEQNYAQELINRAKDLEEKWTELYKQFRKAELERREFVRQQKKEADDEKDRLAKEWEENKKAWEAQQQKPKQENSQEGQGLQESNQDGDEIQDKNKIQSQENQSLIQTKNVEKEPYDPSTVQKPESRPISERINDELEHFLYWMKKEKPPQVYQVENWNLIDDREKFWRQGLKSIAKGQVALCILAGGSATRLGCDIPKGFYQPGLPSGKCLFQVFFDRIIAIQRLAAAYRPDKAFLKENSSIHVYIMTSQENDEITKKLFKDNLNFGFWKKNIHFFKQGQFPALDFKGNILMEDTLKLSMSADGNGGIYEAIEREGLIDEWGKLGIEYVHFVGVDNLLTKPCDPLMVGMLKGIEGESHQLDLVSKYVTSGPGEKTGRIVMQGTAPGVVEYSEIGSDDKIYKDAFIANFAMTRDLVNTFIQRKNEWLTYHLAVKKVPYYIPPQIEGEQGTHVTKEQLKSENAVKFEKFIFDPWRLVKRERFGLLEVDRYEEFAPIKNANPKEIPEWKEDEDLETYLKKIPDTPLSAILIQSELHRKWLAAQGYPTDQRSSLKQITGLEIKTRRELLDQGKDVPADNEESQEKNDKPKKAFYDFSISRNVPGEWKDDQTYFQLYEIDESQTYTGENIKKFDPNQQKAKHLVLPHYQNGEQKPIKPELPFGLAEIYRYL